MPYIGFYFDKLHIFYIYYRPTNSKRPTPPLMLNTTGTIPCYEICQSVPKDCYYAVCSWPGDHISLIWHSASQYTFKQHQIAVLSWLFSVKGEIKILLGSTSATFLDRSHGNHQKCFPCKHLFCIEYIFKIVPPVISVYLRSLGDVSSRAVPNNNNNMLICLELFPSKHFTKKKSTIKLINRKDL